MNDEQFVSVRDALAALVGAGAHATIHGYCTVARRFEHDPVTFPEGCCCSAEGIRCFGDTGVRVRARTLAAGQLEAMLAIARRHGLGLDIAAAAGRVEAHLEPARDGTAGPGDVPTHRCAPSAQAPPDVSQARAQTPHRARDGTASARNGGDRMRSLREHSCRRATPPAGAPRGAGPPTAPDALAATADMVRRALEDAGETARNRRTVTLGREQRDWIWCAAHTLADYATGELTAQHDDRRATLTCAAELHEVVRAFDEAAPPGSDRGRA